MSRVPVYFHSEDVSYSLRHKKPLREWIIKVIASENNKSGEINFIFCSDKYLRKLNFKYLNHHTFTDVITFDNSENSISAKRIGHRAKHNVMSKRRETPDTMRHAPCAIEGDIFISIERVKENAKKFNANFTDELHRVMVHGILHLLGYKDKTHAQKVIMREKEDFYLSLLSFDK